MRISDRSSDVCSSDLVVAAVAACKHPRRRQPGDFLAILLGVHLHGTHTHDRRDIGPRKRGIEIATHRTAIARAITAPEAEHEGWRIGGIEYVQTGRPGAFVYIPVFGQRSRCCGLRVGQTEAKRPGSTVATGIRSEEHTSELQS